MNAITLNGATLVRQVVLEFILPLLPDSDDNIVLACAVVGRADYLVTYDPHFDTLGGEYQSLKIVKALPFP